MDTVQQTAVSSKEDALPKNMDGNNVLGDGPLGTTKAASVAACAADDNLVDSMPATNDKKSVVVGGGGGKVAGLHIAAPSDVDNNDDLLDKIEEVVKEEESNGDIAIDRAITESSEQDFLKKLEEAEAETKMPTTKETDGQVVEDVTKEKDAGVDLTTEDNVSSSDDKKEMARNAVDDETDRVHVVDDNATVSTNVVLMANKKSEIIRLDSMDSDVEFVPSEAKDTETKDKKAIKAIPKDDDVVEVEESRKKIDENSIRLSETKKGLENGEIDLTTADDSENGSDKDEIEVVPNKDANACVSTSGAKDIEFDTKQKDVDEVADIAAVSASNELSEKESEDIVSLSSGEDDKNDMDKQSKPPTAPSAVTKETPVAQRMSVDEGSTGAVETMDVDEEEGMDVDLVESISDEEMPPIAAPEQAAVEATTSAINSNQQPVAVRSMPPEKSKDQSPSKAVDKTPSETVEKKSTLDEIKPKKITDVTSESIDAEELASTEEIDSDDIEDELGTTESDKKTNETTSKKGELEKRDIVKQAAKDIEIAEKTKISPKTSSEITLTDESLENIEKLDEDKTIVSKVKSPLKSVNSNDNETIEEANTNQNVVLKDASVKQSEKSATTTKETIDAERKEQEDVTTKLGYSKPENKLLTNAMKHDSGGRGGDSVISLENSPVATTTNANVFNSTPIQKQFDISSENVSKISDVHEDVNRTTEEVTTSSSLKTEEDTCETGTSSNSDTTHQTTDSATKFLNIIKKQYNGTSSKDIELPKTSKQTATTSKLTEDKPFEIIPIDLLSKSVDSCPKSNLYEIHVWNDENDIRFLSVEKLEPKKTVNTVLDSTSGGESTEKLSSNGSVSSLPPFTLSSRTLDILSGSSTSSKTPEGNPSLSQANRSTQTITGIVELCKFMIDQFTNIKNKHEPPTTPTSSKASPNSEKLKGGQGSTKKGLSKTKTAGSHEDETETPTKKVDKRTLKRALTKTHTDDEEEIKPKQSKQGKTSKSHDVATKSAVEQGLYCCLAKWVDKKYYAGRVTEEKAGNKFVVLFEDGASKVLPRESIVFGEGDTLPLIGHYVYAQLDDDYELGTVKSVEKTTDKVLYTVDIDGKDINVSASDIYLTDQQAKIIQSQKDAQSTPTSSNKNIDSPTEKFSPGGALSRSTRKRPATSPITPEAGFSGGVSKRGGRKPKRSRTEQRLSESTDLSDSPETIAPPSPESALESIEGVQPELQKTPKESEISRMIIMSEFMITDPALDILDIIGTEPKSKTLFKNKCFLMTCTVAQKFPPLCVSSGENGFPNWKHQIPFIKENLRKQIEQGGGKVYDHFENVPKNKYRQCKLIASQPCTTAKYVQCLAADIQAISHEWIIDSCNQNKLGDHKKYILPSGWSIIHNKYLNWSVGKTLDHRQSVKPFYKQNILIASEHKDFVEFWSRVCKLAGGTLRFIKSLNDVTPTTTGYLVTEQDFPQIIKSKAEHYGIPIVSTLWIVQSLITGKVCNPNAHIKLTQFYHDDDL